MKRKTSPSGDSPSEESTKRRFIEAVPLESQQTSTEATSEATVNPPDATAADQIPESSPLAEPAAPDSADENIFSTTPPPAQQSRADRFKALQARQAAARKQNLQDSAAELSRTTQDPALLAKLSRKSAVASHKLLQADAAAAGEDFERKRAWDWTVEESERWDRRLEKKEKHRQNTTFADYREEARKVYKRQLRELKPDVEDYTRGKMEAVQRSAEAGGLEIVETEDGELVAVDQDGSWYSTKESTDFMNHKPSKEKVDRLVENIRKAEEVRLKNRRDRQKDGGDGDVTYINVKNKQFNEKLKRFYDKYTADIRDSFERGTAM